MRRDWPGETGANETLATFRSAADRCDEHPAFIFTKGEAWAYQPVERLDPDLFERVRRLVARGQWHIPSGQVIQPDANLPTGQGWRKQLAHGQRYFREGFAEGGAWTVEETGPLRALARLEGWLGASRVRWTVSLARTEPQVTLCLDVLFAERHTALQLPIHLASLPAGWRDGQPGGQVERRVAPDGRPIEWPVQGWSCVPLSTQGDQGDAGFLSVLTQDAYSVSLDGEGHWVWTLLRSPKMARFGDDWAPGAFLDSGRATYNDQGEHTFQFVLRFDQEAPTEEQLMTRARRLSQRPIVFDRYDGLNRPPWGAVPPAHLRM